MPKGLIVMARDTLPQPTHRHRSKSAVRGRSPDPKSLKKAAARARKEKEAAAFITPPPKRKNRSPGASGSSGAKSSKPDPRRISFSGKNTVHPIEAENQPPKEISPDEADEILQMLKTKDPIKGNNNLGISNEFQ